jgi:hypothetical protein
LFCGAAAHVYTPTVFENFDELIMRAMQIYDCTSTKGSDNDSIRQAISNRYVLKGLLGRSAKFIAEQLGEVLPEDQRERFQGWLWSDAYYPEDKKLWQKFRDFQWEDENPVIAVNCSVLWQLVCDFIFTDEMLSILCNAHVKEIEYVDPFAAEDEDY